MTITTGSASDLHNDRVDRLMAQFKADISKMITTKLPKRGSSHDFALILITSYAESDEVKTAITTDLFLALTSELVAIWKRGDIPEHGSVHDITAEIIEAETGR